MAAQDINPEHKEWSYAFSAEEVDRKPVHVDIEAPESAFSALCSRLGIVSIESLKANLTLVRNDVNKVVNIHGRILADVHQKCVVTAEAVEEHVDDTFEAWFAEPNNAVSFTKAKRERTAKPANNEHPMLEEEEDPEEIIDGKIDLGELVIQYLSLSLNPYPKKEGAEYENKEASLDHDQDVYSNPFAALKEWKADEKKKGK